MKDFLKYTLASCLGLFVAMFVMGIFTSILLGVAVSSASGGGGSTAEIDDESILKITFEQTPPELTNNVASSNFDFENPDVLGIHRIISLIEHARDDDKIKGIFIDADVASIGMSSARLIREAIDSFQLSEKPVIAHANNYGQMSYYLASIADEVMISPTGFVDFRGFAAVNPFVKDMLTNIGVEMEIYYAGDFKSATEMFRRTDMSEENREQTRAFLDDMYGQYLEDLAASRPVSESGFRALANNLETFDPKFATEKGMFDAMGYQADAIARIKELIDMDEDDKISLVSLDDYDGSYSPKVKGDKDQRIAVVFAEGEINDGNSTEGVISGGKYASLLKKLRDKEKVKAVVLRVNSPGGSVIASDEIWQEVEALQAAGKPVVVSMGDLAASGGYYISCGADKIFSEPTTLTGSIGVFTMIPNVSELFNDKLDVYFDTVATGVYSARMNGIYKHNEKEANAIQRMVDQTYANFLARVAEGRGMTVEEVHKVAQGRVWTGERALEHGLVDELGDLDMAIEEAAELAELDDYRLYAYPKMKNPLEQMIAKFTGQDASVSAVIQKEMDALLPGYSQVRSAIEQKTPQARMTLQVQY